MLRHYQSTLAAWGLSPGKPATLQSRVTQKARASPQGGVWDTLQVHEQSYGCLGLPQRCRFLESVGARCMGYCHQPSDYTFGHRVPYPSGTWL